MSSVSIASEKASGTLKASTLAFPQQGKIEISLKHWQKDWMKLNELNQTELKRFSNEITSIQKNQTPLCKKIHAQPRTYKKIHTLPRSLIKNEENSTIYQVKISDKVRVFFELIFELTDKEKAYLLRIDPKHKSFDLS